MSQVFADTTTGQGLEAEPGLGAPPKTSSANPAGETLLDTAQSCLAKREWVDAIKAGLAAKVLRPADERVACLLMEAAANSNNYSLLQTARESLGPELPRTVDALIASTTVALSQQNYRLADSYARQALSADPSNPRAWTLLAASYAGLGWFEESEECLDGASRHGQASELDLWYVGRSTNAWADEQTPTLIVALSATLIAGILIGLAVALLAPFISRDLRVRKLPDRVKELANVAWADTFRRRLISSVLSLSLLASYVMVMLG